ncbi:MAG: RHS repeat-associated core domain-containing protein, partial [Bacteroidota bacterium]|nr:RHS repeat-associated core domain-containing protein [Bacteroidota bacterium]
VHRLQSISGEHEAYFSYDGAGKRLAATREGVTTRYIYDASGNLLAEADSSNNILSYYVYGKGLLSMVTPFDQTYCYHFDATGNTVAMTDTGRTIVNSYSYTPFGIIIGENETVQQPFKYVGRYGVMAETNGFYYMRARYYDPQVGRFISEDPIGFGGGDVNLYAYVAGNPIMGVDPSGLDTYRQNRVLGMLDSKGTATRAPLTHSFVYTTNSDGSLKHTYSWGNVYEDGNGVWRKDRPEDVNAANQAINNPAVRGDRVGNSTLDSHVDRLFNQWRDDLNHPSRHANWIVYNNCKTEATRLINAAKTQRSVGGKQN